MRKAIFLLTFIFLYGCFEKPSEPVMPSWDVNLTVPIFDRSFTLGELIEKDTSYLKVGANNQIYYATTNNLEATKIGDNLKISDVSTSAQTRLGNFEIKNPGTASARITANQIFPTLPPNLPPGNYVIPSNFPGQTISTNFTAFENFQTVTFDAGILRVTINNGLPVPLILIGGLKIYAQGDPSNPIITLFRDDTIRANSSKTSEANLAGRSLPSNLGLTATVLSPGSGGTPVYFDINQMVVTVSASLENLSIASATARIPAQTKPVVIDTSFIFEQNEPQPNVIQQVTFKSGQLRLRITNNIDLGLNGTLTLYNFIRKSDNTPLRIPLSIGRKNSANNVISQNVNLADYRLVGDPSNPNALSNKISYRVEVRTEDTGNEFRTINKNDGLSAEIALSNLVIESVSGKVKPTRIDFEEQRIDLSGLKDYREKFKGNLRLDDIQVEINLVKTAQFSFDMNLKIKAVNQKTGKTDSLEIPIDQRRFSGTSHRIVLNKNNSNIVNFINSFTSAGGELPEYISVLGFVFLNPDYQTGRASSSDSIYGSVSVNFPLSVGISNAEFKDTSEVEELSSETKKELDKMNYGKLFVEIENGIGVELKFRATILGFVMDSLISIPKASNFTIPSASVDNNGFSVRTSKFVNVIELEKSEIQKLKNMKFIRSFISLATAGNGNVVKFRTTDSIKVKIYGRLNYKVEF